MANTMFMRVEEVAEEMGVSVPYAYKLIRRLNKKSEQKGCITISGRINRKIQPFGQSFKICCNGKIGISAIF